MTESDAVRPLEDFAETGSKAFRMGIKADGNPWPRGTEHAKAWQQGWTLAMRSMPKPTRVNYAAE